MTTPTQSIRDEHHTLLGPIDELRVLARDCADMSSTSRRRRLSASVTFLHETLLPHAAAEERVLYPEWAQLVGAPEAAAPMVHDHREIARRAALLEQVDIDDVAAVQEMLYGLHALITSHFRKEEDIQLPVLDRQPPDQVQQMLERMHHAPAPVEAPRP